MNSMLFFGIMTAGSKSQEGPISEVIATVPVARSTRNKVQTTKDHREAIATRGVWQYLAGIWKHVFEAARYGQIC